MFCQNSDNFPRLKAREINENFDKTRVKLFPYFTRHHLIGTFHFFPHPPPPYGGYNMVWSTVPLSESSNFAIIGGDRNLQFFKKGPIGIAKMRKLCLSESAFAIAPFLNKNCNFCTFFAIVFRFSHIQSFFLFYNV